MTLRVTEGDRSASPPAMTRTARTSSGERSQIVVGRSRTEHVFRRGQADESATESGSGARCLDVTISRGVDDELGTHVGGHRPPDDPLAQPRMVAKYSHPSPAKMEETSATHSWLGAGALNRRPTRFSSGRRHWRRHLSPKA